MAKQAGPSLQGGSAVHIPIRGPVAPQGNGLKREGMENTVTPLHSIPCPRFITPGHRARHRGLSKLQTPCTKGEFSLGSATPWSSLQMPPAPYKEAGQRLDPLLSRKSESQMEGPSAPDPSHCP